jgi:hypothetical protein
MTRPDFGYFNYGPTFTEVFSPSGGKFKIKYIGGMRYPRVTNNSNNRIVKVNFKKQE